MTELKLLETPVGSSFKHQAGVRACAHGKGVKREHRVLYRYLVALSSTSRPTSVIGGRILLRRQWCTLQTPRQRRTRNGVGERSLKRRRKSK